MYFSKPYLIGNQTIAKSASKLQQVRLLSVLLVTMLAMTASGCGNNKSSSGGAGVPQDTKIARIKIIPGTVMLTEVGETRALQAKAFNAFDEELDAAFTWTSSHPDQIEIDAAGEIIARSLGSAEIKAVADGVTSQSAIALVTTPVAGALLVTDEQIIEDPAPVDGTTPFGLGFQYKVTLRGISPPFVGEILLGTGEAPVGGRVVAVEQAGQNVVVTLEVIPISEMFDRFVFNETIDLKTAPITVPEAVSEFYDLQTNPDGSLLFTLKPDVPAAGKPETEIRSGVRRAPIGTSANPFHPFDCEFTTGPFFSLNALSPTITLERDLSLPIIYDDVTGDLRKLSLKGRVKGVFQITNTLTAQFEAKASCKREMIRITIPIGGPIALIFGGQVPVGIGFEVGGKVTFAGAGFTLKAEAEATTEIGMTCPASSPCGMINTFDVTGQTTADWVLPDGFNPDAQLRFEPALSGFGFAKLSLGPSSTVLATQMALQQALPFINVLSVLSIDAFEFKAGPTLGANLAPVEGQILSASYASDYKLSLDFKAGPSQNIAPILGVIGVSLVNAQFAASNILTTSPGAAEVTVDRADFGQGDIVGFAVKLDPTTINFIPGVYNVESIHIYRKITQLDGSTTVEEVAFQASADGQSEFSLSWVALESDTSASNFFAFVSTKLLPIPFLGELELKVATAPGPGSGEIAFVRAGEIYVMNADGSNQQNLTNNPAFDAGPAWSPDRTKIAFQSNRDGNNNIFVMNANGSNPQNLTNNPAFDVDPSWSPDGTKIAFRSTRSGISQIFVMDADGSNPQNLSNNSEGDSFPAWSPDGAKIAFLSSRDGNPEIFVMNADDGSNPQNLSNNPATDAGPAWSSDGSKIAFFSSRDGNQEIYVMNADGSNPQNLSNNPAFDQNPTWSPDGSKIAFSTSRDGNSEIYVMNADGSNPQNLSNTPTSENFPSWSR